MTEERITEAVVRMQACVTYMPQSGIFQTEMIKFLIRIIGTGDIVSRGVSYTPEMRLEWLTDAMIHHVGKWPEEGFKEIRGVYCCKFKPADKGEAYSTLRGFTPEDIERGAQAGCLSAPEEDLAFLPSPEDDPIGDLLPQVQSLAVAKRIPR